MLGLLPTLRADHLGLKGIHTLDQLAKLKGVIPETVRPGGYAILNAEDALMFTICEEILSAI
jgi:cyanophycin synthetase